MADSELVYFISITELNSSCPELIARLNIKSANYGKFVELNHLFVEKGFNAIVNINII